MKPATQFLLLGVAAVVILATAAAAVTLRQVDHRAQVRLLDQLQGAATVERELQASRLIELQLRAELLAQDSAFVDYVAQSLIPNPQLGGAVDSASISDLLKERRHGYDIAVVLDPSGKLVATSGILLKDHDGIRRDPLVTSAISLLKPQQGVWVDQGRLLWVAVNPLLRGGVLQGVLLTASHVDDAFAIAVSRIARTDVTVLVQPTPGSDPAPSSGLDSWIGQALSARLPAVLGVTAVAGKAMPLTDGQRTVSAWVTPLKTSGGQAALVAIGPDEHAEGGIDVAALPLLAGIGGFGMCALLLVLLQWWRTWLPLQRMLDVVQIASPGDQHLTIRVNGSPMVRRLRDAINRLLHPSV
ncbi:MAG: hypothetical protein ABI227_01735 [Rhodanobacter sp.]